MIQLLEYLLDGGEAEYVNFDTGEIKTIYTSCVDWEAIETILERMGML